ncbi:MAG: methionine adenosyltransferase [Candidatus Omnitrophica bacterium 4484_213]|nr:MAG: methionine adenosyltransferase [Candidatus Omnitrophica bacterium 4484_213]
MLKHKYLFTSESVTEGHPDKIADQISDAVLDEVLRNDPQGKVACETLVTTGLAFVAGEISTSCYVNIPKVVRNVIKEVGYTDAVYGFDYLTCGVITAIQEQSPDIALGVDKGGAGDQGMVFGYATDETPEFMPLPIILAHKLVRRLAKVRKEKLVDYLRPDGKSQVTIEYDNGRPQRVDTIVISAQHKPGMKLSRLKEDIKELVINKVIPEKFLDKNKPPKILINPTGRFEIGGPQGDTGLTGRKIIVDTYGGVGSHGGGCFSGKDPTKVDRSGSYIARYIAKNIVAAGLTKKCEIQIAYAIGVPEPVSLTVNTYKTGKLHELEINKLIRKNFDLTPQGIIKTLNLREPIYKKTACYGHFGRREFSWEKIDRVESLKKGIK